MATLNVKNFRPTLTFLGIEDPRRRRVRRRTLGAAAWRVAGVGTPPMSKSISARTRAASISRVCLISS